MAVNSFDLNRLNNPLCFFIYHTRDLYISSRLTSVLHALLVMVVLYVGEFFILVVSGLFATSDLLFSETGSDISTFAVTSLNLNSYTALKNIQALVLSLLATATVYVALVDSRRNKRV